MSGLLLIALAGFLASAVDGALGMGFGPTSATILLSTGLSPAATSATVNLAKVATGLAAGASHWRFRNIDRDLVLRLAIPGAAGALVGTTVLTRVDAKDLRPVLALLLLLVGLRILIRFSRALPSQNGAAAGSDVMAPALAGRGTEMAGAAGGLTNGLVGAWGPVVTPYLLHRGVAPRFAVGSVNTAEVAVAVVAAGSLLGSVGGQGLELGVVLAMLLGGVVAAPLAAYVVRFVPARLLGLAVACLLLLTQSRELAGADLLPVDRWFAYAGVLLAVAAAVLRPRLRVGTRRTTIRASLTRVHSR
ncbi:MAG: sulfite exporter TauE/SafE family protein [Microthrixaceae bacterium]